MKTLVSLVALTLAVTVAPAARGQAPPVDAPPPPVDAPPPPANAPAPDVVIMKNGGMLRGTISELVPDEYVLIVTLAGETRRIAMSEVKYAGPTASAPAASAPPTEPSTLPSTSVAGSDGKVKPFTTVHAEEARVRLIGEPGVTFHRRSGSATAGNVTAVGFDELCAAPCEVSLPAGTYTLAMSKGTGKPEASSDSVTLPAGTSTVEGTYVDRSGLRTAGWITFAAGLGVGGYFMLTASEEVEDCSSALLGCKKTTELNDTKLYGGMGIMVVGLAVGMALVYQTDSARFTVVPGSPSARSSAPSQLDSLARLGDPRGFSVIGHF